MSDKLGRYRQGVVPLSQSQSRTFPARYDSECAICHQPILRGQHVQYVTDALVHAICPSPDETGGTAT